MSGVVLNMKKGDTITLRGDLKFSVLMLGVGWSERKSTGPDIDVDPAVIGRDVSGNTRLKWICYFNQGDIGWAKHSGDSITGVGQLDESGDDERMWIDLANVPREVNSIDLVITLYEGQKRRETFGDLTWGVIRLVNVPTMGEIIGDEKIRMELTMDQLFNVTGALALTIVRRGPTWGIERMDLTDARWADIQSAADAVNPAK